MRCHSFAFIEFYFAVYFYFYFFAYENTTKYIWIKQNSKISFSIIQSDFPFVVCLVSVCVNYIWGIQFINYNVLLKNNKSLISIWLAGWFNLLHVFAQLPHSAFGFFLLIFISFLFSSLFLFYFDSCNRKTINQHQLDYASVFCLFVCFVRFSLFLVISFQLIN